LLGKLELDPNILIEIRAGKQDAFERLFKAFYQQLCHYAFNYLKDSDEAEETVQDVMVKLWENRAQIETIQNIKSYLFRSVTNRCLNRIKHEAVKQMHRNESLFNSKSETSALQNLEKNELEKSIQNALNHLPEQCRRAFELSRFNEMSYKEIAETMEISIKTVENHIGKALKIMRNELAAYLTLLFFIYNLCLNFQIKLGVNNLWIV